MSRYGVRDAVAIKSPAHPDDQVIPIAGEVPAWLELMTGMKSWEMPSGGGITIETIHPNTRTPTAAMSTDSGAALGIPFDRRGRILDEQLEVLQLLWQESPASFQGAFLQSKSQRIPALPDVAEHTL